MGATAKSMTVHFTVDGDWLTDTVRRLWADEGEPEKAINILRAAFPAMEQSDMLAILTGSKKLIGNSDGEGMPLVDDDATTSSLGNPLDIASILGRMRKARDEKTEEAADYLQLLLGDTVLVGSPKGAVRVPRRRTEQNHVTGISGLREDVDLERIPHEECPIRLRPRAEDEDIEADHRVHASAQVLVWAKRLGRDEPDGDKAEALLAKLRRMRDEGVDLPKPPPPKGHDAIDANCGWLSPEGKFYPCEYSEHRDLADTLCEEVLGVGTPVGERALEERNWIKVQNGKFIRDDYDRPPTQRQRDMVFDWSQTTGRAFGFGDGKMPWLCRDDLATEADWDKALEDMAGKS